MIPTFNHTFYLISYLISLSMAPIRRSNRVPKPRDYWDPTISPPRRRQAPAFTIYTDPSEDLRTHSPENLRSQPPKNLHSQLPEGLGTQHPKGLCSQPRE